MHRADDSFFQGHDAAEPVDSIVILSLAILRIGQTSAAPESIGMLGTERALPSVRGTAQYSFGLAIRALLHQQVADGMLDIGPLGGVTLAIGQFFRSAEMFHR